MMHSKRRWGLAEIESAETLAKMLTESTWTLCSGFFVAGHPEYLFLNDATHEDGALEMAVYGAVVVMWWWCSSHHGFGHFSAIYFT